MSDKDIRPEAIENIFRLTTDLKSEAKGDLDKLRSVLLSASSSATDMDNKVFEMPQHLARLKLDEEVLRKIPTFKPNSDDLKHPPLHIVRRDEREDLLALRFADPLTALGGAERIGPFFLNDRDLDDRGVNDIDVNDRQVFFQLWREAKRFEITENGASKPAFVISSGRLPRISRGSTTLDLQKGTIWIRGDLLNAGLPTGAYVGITVSDGKLRLSEVTESSSGKIEIASPLEVSLELELTAEEQAVEPGGCVADTSLELPKLTLKFGPDGLDIEGTAGQVKVWGQAFKFPTTTGDLTFIPQLWALLLGYTFDPETLDASQITSTLADFDGKAEIKSAALALPVVVAEPAALGPAALSPGFWMSLHGLQSRWYTPDERFHSLDPWLAINNRAVAMLDISVAPLPTAVETSYRLWALPDSEDQRLPWHYNYRDSFMFYYVCDVKSGESLVATAESKIALDRPVQANGQPVPTPIDLGVLLLRSSSSGIRALLAATVNDSEETQLVLRNALVWATQAARIFAEGTLQERQLINNGRLLLQFGVYSWTPTLPDPYVGNFELCRPSFDQPRALLGALVQWPQPDKPETVFLGNMGGPMVCSLDASPDKPKPAPRSDLNPSVGVTQTEQGQLYLDKENQGLSNAARAKEQKERSRRAKVAAKQNINAHNAVEGQLAERLGRTPPLLLLDISTNQDLLGVALWDISSQVGTTAAVSNTSIGSGVNYSVNALDITSRVEALRLITLPQVQWEPVRTLNEDQDILTLGWFPTPLASSHDGGPTVLGTRSQKLAPVIPEPLLDHTKQAFDEGQHVTFRTTLPFGLITVVDVNPQATAARKADSYEITRPEFTEENATGGLQITAKAEGGINKEGGISPYFAGTTRQLINGIDLASGAPLGLSVLSSTGDPAGDVETIFNNDMTANPKSPVTRFDLSGYGGSNFSKWENPFALFAETAKTQFQMTIGRTALEIIKVASVLHPWGIKVTRSVIVERRSGGGVIRRDTGWQATSPGLLDYRYSDPSDPAPDPQVANYDFDAGIFKGLFDVRTIRPAPGVKFSNNGATFVPYYFDADLALDGLSGRTPANGMLGWLQTAPNGDPASELALQALIEAQGSVGGPIDTWINFGASDLPFRARRLEIDVINDGGSPLFVAAVRGTPKLPSTGAWSVVQRPVAGIAPGDGEAVPVSESKGVPIIRRYAVKYPAGNATAFAEPPRDGSIAVGDWRMADPVDLLTPGSPQNDYALLQSAPTHGFLFPRPYARNSGQKRVRSDKHPELADIIARSTSKGAFPPPENVIELASPMHFNVGAGGTLSLSNIVNIVNHPIPLQLAGTTGHGSQLSYEDATIALELAADHWNAEFTGLTLWSDIAGLERASGAKMRVVGSTDQRPQVAEIDTLVYEPVEKILSYLPVFGARDVLGPIDLGATNAKHEVKVVIETIQEVPKKGFSVGGGEIKLVLGAGGSTGWDSATGGAKSSGILSAGAKGEFPILSVGAASVFIIVQLDVKFSITSVTGVVTEEKLELIAFAGIGVKGQVGPFKAYAYLGIGFVFIYDFVSDTAKFGGLVAFEAGVDLKVVKVKLRAELKGVVYKKTEPLPPPAVGTTEKTLCDYSGKVKLQVDIFLIISISATYTVSDTKTLE